MKRSNVRPINLASAIDARAVLISDHWRGCDTGLHYMCRDSLLYSPTACTHAYLHCAIHRSSQHELKAVSEWLVIAATSKIVDRSAKAPATTYRAVTTVKAT